MVKEIRIHQPPPWPRRPAMELMNNGRSVTQVWLQPNIFPHGCRSLKISSSTSMAPLSHTQCWFVCSKSASDHQGVVWIQSFPFLGNQSETGWASPLAATMPAKQFGPRLLIGYLQLSYTCVHTYTHTNIHIHTCAHTHMRPATYQGPSVLMLKTYWD